MELRQYQIEAEAAVHHHLLTRTDNPCVEIPTGGGKSLVIAAIASRVVDSTGGQVVVLAHTKELLEQNAQAIRKLKPHLDVGVYSSGLKSHQHVNQIVVASIQSVARKSYLFPNCKMIIIDEAHLIQPQDQGQYSKFIKAMRRHNPSIRVVGMTATPYRTSTGVICGPNGILNHICYRVGVRELVAADYLSNMISKRGLDLNFQGLHVLAGEFRPDEAESLMVSVVHQAVAEILRFTGDRKSCLVFCQSVNHAKQIQSLLTQHGAACGHVDGKSDDRDETIAAFKKRKIKFLTNVQVLTTGFDFPGIDCVVLLRPTRSPGLYYQMVGRGFRKAEGKENCLVLDFGGNVERHGPVDAIVPLGDVSDKSNVGVTTVKACPKCGTYSGTATVVCAECGYLFSVPDDPTHEGEASDAAVLSSAVAQTSRPDWIADLHAKWEAIERRPLGLDEFVKLCGDRAEEGCRLFNVTKGWSVGGTVTWEWFRHAMLWLDGTRPKPQIKVSVVSFGRQYLYMRYKCPSTGKVVTKTTGTADRDEANIIASRWEAELLATKFKPASDVTWSEFTERYTTERLSSLSRGASSRVRGVFNAIDTLIGVDRLVELDTAQVSRFQRLLRDEQKLSEASIKSSLAHLKAALNWAKQVGLLDEVPRIEMPNVDSSNVRTKCRHMTRAEFDQLVAMLPSVLGNDAADAVLGNWQQFLESLWDTGLRLGEALDLSWDEPGRVQIDLSGEYPMYRSPSGGSLSPVPYDVACVLLKVHKTDRHGPVFKLTRRGGCHRIGLLAASKIISQCGKAAGIVVRESPLKYASAEDIRATYELRTSIDQQFSLKQHRGTLKLRNNGRKLPGYLLHKATGQARCRIDGHDYYLGQYGSKESFEKYRQAIGHTVGNEASNPPEAT